MSRHSIPNPDTVDWEYARETIRQQREWERQNRARLDAEWDALPEPPPRTIEDHIAKVREEVGELEWRRLNQEWLNREGG